MPKTWKRNPDVGNNNYRRQRDRWLSKAALWDKRRCVNAILLRTNAG